MTDHQRFSRTDRHKKRRNSKRKFFFFASLAIVFCIVLFSLIVFGNREPAKDTASNETKEEANVDQNEEDIPSKHHDEDTDVESTEDKKDDSDDPLNKTDVEDRVETEDEDEEKSDANIKEVESDDSNVIQAYEGDWKPVGTEQQGDHTTNYENDSQDRMEIKKAVSQATNISEENIIEHWVGNGGDQKVVATIQDESTAEFYRVYLDWVDNKGWKTTKYEEIKEKDTN